LKKFKGVSPFKGETSSYPKFIGGVAKKGCRGRMELEMAKKDNTLYWKETFFW